MFDKSSLLSTFDSIYENMRRADDGSPIPQFQDAVPPPPRRVHPFLYLPVEVKARELHAKAILARQVVDAGMRVVIGAIWSMHDWSEILPPGIVLFKTMNTLDARNMMLWANRGHMIAALDEEVFGVMPSPGYLAATTHPYAAAVADLVCAQGPAYANSFPYPSRIKVTGTPRTLTYAQANGDDILVCLQFGNINNNGRAFDEMVTGTLQLCSSLGTEQGGEWAKILREAIAQECDLLPLTQKTILALADAFPDRRIVVRPHPVEDASIWSFDKPNIFIDHSNSVLDAISTAGVLVYLSGCTTGLDAHLSGLPAVRLGAGGHGVSARMNVPATSPAEAVEAVRRAEKWNGDLHEHFAPLTLAEKILDLLNSNRASGPARLSAHVKAVPKEFHLRKFPTTPVEEIENLVGKPAKEIGWNTFLI